MKEISLDDINHKNINEVIDVLNKYKKEYAVCILCVNRDNYLDGGVNVYLMCYKTLDEYEK